MFNLRAILLGVALAGGSIAGADAADLGRGGSIKDGYVPMTYTSPSSWYVRADVGYARHDEPTMIEDGRFDLSGRELGDTWTLGGGFGRYFSKNVRGDLTWDHRFEADAKGHVPAFLVDFPGERRFGLKSDVFLANLYYDIDISSRFKPYVGIGIGATRNTTTAGTVIDTCVCGFTNTSIEGATRWSVAGALMSGFSLALRDRLHLDAGYRFLYLGEANTGLISGTLAGGGSANDGDPVIKDIWAHEFRVGMRYDIR